MRPLRYVGITGFMCKAEVRGVLNEVRTHTPRLIMIGVLVSHTTLHGGYNKHSQKYPRSEHLRKIFGNDKQTLNLIHYNTDTPDSLFSDMCMAQFLAGEYCHGFQLNVTWPSPAAIELYRRRAPATNRTIVLQCGPEALAEVEYDARKLAARVREYHDLVDYVLIDPSAGKGLPFNTEFAQKCFSAIEDVEPSMGLAVAGGLSAETISTIEELKLAHRDFSIDAESRVTTHTTRVAYLEAADRLFQRSTVLA